MDAKDLRAEAALTERSNDGVPKFAFQYDRSKSHDAGTSTLKGDTPGVRPCAVIGPDRIVPPARDGPKKTPVEPWLAPDPMYRRLPDYPYKMPDHKDPTRNISPRQTFQENMQRIIMPPGYNATKLHEDPTFATKNTKLNVPTEVKYCEVPYNINQVSSDQKHIRNVDHSASNVNPMLMRGVPHGWPAGSVHVRPLRTFGAPDMLPYPDYSNCTGPRPVPTRTHASTHEEPLYPEAYYHESNIRYKPYPNLKERYPQSRYEYIGNYPSPYHPPNPYAHKYELPKTMPPHSYPGYPQVPKYPERIPDPLMEGYQRALTQQGNYGVPIRNPVIHPPYRPVPGNHMQNKLNLYPSDGQHKPVLNKMPYDPASKMYLDYDSRSKQLPMSDNYYLNDLPRPFHPKTTVVPNYPSASMHGANVHPYMSLKNFEYSRYKNMDPSMINHSLTKLPSQFSPSTLAISPADSNASNETAQTHGASQEDFGYVSQSSATSVRSIDSLNRIPMDPYGRYDYRYGQIVRTSPSTKPDPSSNHGSKSKKDIRQFISSWSEGDDENAENSAKRDVIKNIPDEKHTFNKQYDAGNNHEQLYVLGLVNVPSEELSKYEHIQKVSKLPENIKGYNSLELLSQFEEAIESSNITSVKPSTPRTVQMSLKSIPHKHDPIPRALSPLDVEAKISQSVIHKEVGCNFEIKPCSPKMLNVEVAAPMQMLNERVIEKVVNPHNVKSPLILQGVDEIIDHTTSKTTKCLISNTASSCKMINSQHLLNSPTTDHLKTSYTLQDLESNSGVCLASLPRLDTDIELNFPEVNQQFINANKTDSVITKSFPKDLPTLDMDRSAITGSECDMNYQYSPKIENETDFSRLSKYRKLKKCAPDEQDTALAKVQATRVDSVIIKNPDNTKSCEENSDNPENHFTDDLQEFAMNLVSQSKHSNDQPDVDKVLEGSTNFTNTVRYDDSKNLQQINVTEQASPDVHAQTQGHGIHSQDHINRFLKRPVMNIPMNLSPQARYSTTEVDEATKNGKEGDNSVVLEEKHQFPVDSTDLNKKLQCKEKCISKKSSVALDETDIMISQKGVVVNQCLNISDKHLTKSYTPVNCVSTVSSNETEIEKNVKSPSVLLDDQTFHIGSLKQEETYNVKKNQTVDVTDKITESKCIKVKQARNIMDTNKEKDRDESKPIVYTDKGKSKNPMDCLLKNQEIISEKYYKNHDKAPYVPKLKRKKFRGELARRKKSYENKSEKILDQNIENNTEKPSTMLPKTDKDPMEQGTSNQTQIVLKTDTEVANTINFITKGHPGIGNIGTQKDKKHTDEKIDIPVNTIQNIPSDIETNMSISCSPTKNNCFEKILDDDEMKVEVQNSSQLDFENNDQKCNINADSDMEVKRASDDLEHASMFFTNITTAVSIGQFNSKKHYLAQANRNLKYEAKEYSTLVKHQQDNIESANVNINLENNLNMQVSPALRQTASNEIKNHPIINCDDKEGAPSDDTNDTRELHVIQNTIRLHKNEHNLQKGEDIDMTSCLNGAQHCQAQMCDGEVNSSYVSCEHKINTDVSDDETNTRHVSVCHSFVNKELFSSRFQNLLFYNEHFDTISAAALEWPAESKIDDKQSTSSNYMTERSEIFCTSKDSNDENIMDLCLSPLTEVTGEHNLINTKDDMMVDKSPEYTNLKPCTQIKDNEEVKNLSVTTETISSNETEMIPCNDTSQNSVGNSVCMKLSPEKDNERDFQISNTIPDTNSFDNSDYKSSFQDIDDICVRNPESNSGESKSYFQFTYKDAVKKSVNYSICDLSSREMDENSVNISENSKPECESNLQFINKDTIQQLADNLTYESSSSETGDEYVKKVKYSKNESDSNQEFLNNDTVQNVVGNYSDEPSSLDHDSVCALDFKFTKNDTLLKSVDDTDHKISSNKFDDVRVENLANNNDDCESDLQFTDNVEGDACATKIIVIDESTSTKPEDGYGRITTPQVKEFDKKAQSIVENLNARPLFSLKRSLSDSALNAYDDDVVDCSEKKCMLPKKRKKLCGISKIDESHLLNIIQTNRRNSVSTLSNENFSFCILIDDQCIVTEETYEQENFTQLDDNLFNHPLKDPVMEDENPTPVYNFEDQIENTPDTYITKYDEEKIWVEDVGCEETIETEDIAENIIIGDPVSPMDTDLTDYESDDEGMDTLNNEDAEHTSKVKHIYGDNMCTNDAQLVEALYRTPQMDVNKRLMDKESQISVKDNKYYDSDSLEMLLAEPVDTISHVGTKSNTDLPTSQCPASDSINKENRNTKHLEVPPPLLSNVNSLLTDGAATNQDNIISINRLKEIISDVNCVKPQDGTIHSRESGLVSVLPFVDQKNSSHKSSSSPEVSSTTSEEKKSNILLKISNFKGSRISEVKTLASDSQNQSSCKHTTNEYFKPDYSHGTFSKRPLLTKAAQKYIPPLRESIPNLRVKLALPQQSLLKLQKNKVAKDEPKLSTCKTHSNNNKLMVEKEISKKVKPKFEDVLKNIDKAQFQMHKAKNKKSKKYIPKVVIKKSENGSHYASTRTKDSSDPDLTGRKWQPWVFIEKNKFIDNMALRNKARAVFSHRKKTFVLAETFCKYKSISTAKFFISQPKLNDFSTGNLKYTIKLKQR